MANPNLRGGHGPRPTQRRNPAEVPGRGRRGRSTNLSRSRSCHTLWNKLRDLGVGEVNGVVVSVFDAADLRNFTCYTSDIVDRATNGVATFL